MVFDKPLFIYEMANNHQGSVGHGKKIIQEMARVSSPYKEQFQFAVKFQYRNLDTFIHVDAKGREDIKNVKRFQDTRLGPEQFEELIKEAKAQGFYTMCTPFDEDSVDVIMRQQIDIVKIASCSFCDWSLLEKIAGCGRPVIASAAGTPEEDVDKVVSFFCNRKIPFTLMHCVAEYPTAAKNLQMNQIDYYKKRYPGIRIGFSTHEEPDHLNPVKLAVAKGAAVFEKHVGVPTEEIILNGYSANPEQVALWLESAKDAYEMCGVSDKRYEPNQKELDDLAALQRGVFAKDILKEEQTLSEADYYRAFPCVAGQLLSKHISKYKKFTLKPGVVIEKDKPVMLEDVKMQDTYDMVREGVRKVIELIKKSGVTIPVNSTCELSHHYGIEQFYKTGVTMIECINREYCKKILVVLPGQSNPSHMHKKKEETFTVVYGRLKTICDGAERIVGKGEDITVERGVYHSFSSEEGCVFEEISTTHEAGDSYYPDMDAFVTPRKTKVYITSKMLGQE